jgi:predicted MFS family arabinose efflux permease
MYSTAIPLGVCQFLIMAAATVSIAFSGLVGERLAGTAALATLPFLATTAVAAALALIMPRLLAPFGYRKIFLGGALAGAVGGGLAAWSIIEASFVMFCIAGVFLGVYQGSALYYRFAAADAVADAAKGRAIAWVMTGGIPAAFAGPLLGAALLDLLSVQYAGSFIAAALVALLAVPALLVTRLPGPSDSTQHSPKAPAEQPVSVRDDLQEPQAMAAILFCAGGYGLMMLVMLATPLAMSAHTFSANDVASVIQWHLLGMFAPSLITGKLIDRWQARPVATSGCVILAAGCLVGLTSHASLAIHLALLMVGVGWNFMYMGGTTMLTQISDTGAKSRIQALNECTTLVVMTVIAGLSGWLYQTLGWQAVLVTAALLVLVVALLGACAGRPRISEAS